MSDTSGPAANVVRFRRPGPRPSHPGDQHRFLDAVYAAGSLPVAADDRSTKVLATRLTIFGFVAIDEVQRDGSVRRLRPSEAVRAMEARPWRVSKLSSRTAHRFHAPAVRTAEGPPLA